jgi:3-isopropylmalate/(R)-2-methylmalate dehydratase large subunit
VGQTIAEKIFGRVAGRKVKPGEVLYVKPDVIMIYDFQGMDGVLRDIRIEPDRVAYNIDHYFLPTNEMEAKVHKNFRLSAQKYGIKDFFDVGDGFGVHLMGEEGVVRPGMLAIHLDPHISTLGALGAYVAGVSSDVLTGYFRGEVWLKVPESLKIEIVGKMGNGVMARDVFNAVLRKIGPAGGQDKCIEFTGSAVEAMSVDERTVLCNSAQYLSAETNIINPDAKTEAYVKERTDRPFQMVTSDPDANYAGKINLDISRLGPQVVTPPDVYYVKDVGDVEGIKIDQALLGTCAGGRIEDLRVASKILKGKKVHRGVRLIVSPITRRTFVLALKEGLIEPLVEAGAVITSPTCRSCFGAFGYLLPGENCIATGTLNIPGRMGSNEANIYLGSAATVAASAVEGKITDPRKLLG